MIEDMKTRLLGTWRLVSYTQLDPKTGEKVQHNLGKAPRGFLNYGRDGRMYAIIVGSDRPKPVELSKRTDPEIRNDGILPLAAIL